MRMVLFIGSALFMLNTLGGEPVVREVDFAAALGISKEECARQLSVQLQAQKLTRIGAKDEAIKLCDNALKENPSWTLVALERVEAKIAMERLAEAAKELDEMIDAHPTFKPALLLRAELMLNEPIKGDHHPLLDWIQSKDQNKRDYALHVILQALKKIHAGPADPKVQKSSDSLQAK